MANNETHQNTIGSAFDSLLALSSAADLDEAQVSLAYLAGAVTLANNYQRFAVTQFRQSGATWDQVGQALNISRQAAWRRYGTPQTTGADQPELWATEGA